jgi:hypothetical protein
MRRTPIYLLFCFFLLSIFCVVLYSACNKDAHCSGTCLNGGSCTQGICRCVSGFSGQNCEFSSITYANNTRTTLTLKFLSHSGKVVASDTVAPFSTLQYPGYLGDTAIVHAYTYGPTGNNNTVWGDTLKFDTVRTVFSANGTTNVNFNYGFGHFFLRIYNNTVNTITQINVNMSYTGVYHGDTVISSAVSVPGGVGVLNNIGYFVALGHTDIIVQPQGITYGPPLQFSQNQEYILNVP